MHRTLYLVGIGYLAICGTVLLVQRRQPSRHAPATTASVQAAGSLEQAWYLSIKPFCNAVEVEVAQRNRPAPSTVDGQGYSAACYALGGKIDSARAVINRLVPSVRYQAAGIVFNVAHPVADAGDDRSAGPIMELVVDYWPNHYMALYHAGMAEYGLGQYKLAHQHLKSFLQFYHENDGWARNARDVLARLE